MLELGLLHAEPMKNAGQRKDPTHAYMVHDFTVLSLELTHFLSKSCSNGPTVAVNYTIKPGKMHLLCIKRVEV